MSNDPDDFLIVPEAAAELRMAKRTLDNHRWKGSGPKFRRHGGRIVYRRGDLLAWSEERAARMAAGKKSNRSASTSPAVCSSHRSTGTRLDKRKRPKATVESQSKHPNWALLSDQASSLKGPDRDHPSV